MEPLYLQIRNLRKNLGMSQQELAKKTGYTSRSSIAKIENGEVDLPISKIALIAKALDTNPSTLMGLDSIVENRKKESQPFNLKALKRLIDTESELAYKSLVRLCKNKRIQIEWTEKKVSDLSNIDIDEYLRFENYNAKIDIDKIDNILKALNISIEFVLGFISAMLDLRDNKINIIDY
ncbi:MAG: helix-turn-helix domain-containing protein [Thomasclavelia sp.]|uniref:helix-turn-helix domain-containing protein n=1 Tax=Thomasclavelia sp. TaxID=3025757 RepID=UPI0039A252B1